MNEPKTQINKQYVDNTVLQVLKRTRWGKRGTVAVFRNQWGVRRYGLRFVVVGVNTDHYEMLEDRAEKGSADYIGTYNIQSEFDDIREDIYYSLGWNE